MSCVGAEPDRASSGAALGASRAARGGTPRPGRATVDAHATREEGRASRGLSRARAGQPGLPRAGASELGPPRAGASRGCRAGRAPWPPGRASRGGRGVGRVPWPGRTGAAAGRARGGGRAPWPRQAGAGTGEEEGARERKEMGLSARGRGRRRRAVVLSSGRGGGETSRAGGRGRERARDGVEERERRVWGLTGGWAPPGRGAQATVGQRGGRAGPRQPTGPMESEGGRGRPRANRAGGARLG
jgi:hypothetical protein